MSKKLQSEIERVLRDIKVHVEQYDEKFDELRQFNRERFINCDKMKDEAKKEQLRGKKHAIRTTTLELMDVKHVLDGRGRIEGELENLLRKLHRLGQQVKDWLNQNDVRDKDSLEQWKKQLEVRYKRGKIFYRSGEISEVDMSGEGEVTEHQKWIEDYIRRLGDQNDLFEAEIEASKKKKSADCERVEQLKAFTELHRSHMQKLEELLRRIRNGDLSSDSEMEKLGELQEELRDYVENNDSLDIVAMCDDLYADLGLEDMPCDMDKDGSDTVGDPLTDVGTHDEPMRLSSIEIDNNEAAWEAGAEPMADHQPHQQQQQHDDEGDKAVTTTAGEQRQAKRPKKGGKGASKDKGEATSSTSAVSPAAVTPKASLAATLLGKAERIDHRDKEAKSDLDSNESQPSQWKPKATPEHPVILPSLAPAAAQQPPGSKRKGDKTDTHTHTHTHRKASGDKSATKHPSSTKQPPEVFSPSTFPLLPSATPRSFSSTRGGEGFASWVSAAKQASGERSEASSVECAMSSTSSLSGPGQTSAAVAAAAAAAAAGGGGAEKVGGRRGSFNDTKRASDTVGSSVSSQQHMAVDERETLVSMGFASDAVDRALMMHAGNFDDALNHLIHTNQSPKIHEPPTPPQSQPSASAADEPAPMEPPPQSLPTELAEAAESPDKDAGAPKADGDGDEIMERESERASEEEVTIGEDWKAVGEGQLSLSKGTRLRIQERHSSGWTFGQLVRPDGSLDDRPDSSGWFPDFLTQPPPPPSPPRLNPHPHTHPPPPTTDNQRAGGPPTSSSPVSTAAAVPMVTASSLLQRGLVLQERVHIPKVHPTDEGRSADGSPDASGSAAGVRGGGGEEGSDSTDLGSATSTVRSVSTLTLGRGGGESVDFDVWQTVSIESSNEGGEGVVVGEGGTAAGAAASGGGGGGGEGGVLEVREVYWDWAGEYGDTATQNLHFSKGERVEIIVRHRSGWTHGRIVGEPDRIGWFPDFMLTPIEDVEREMRDKKGDGASDVDHDEARKAASPPKRLFFHPPDPHQPTHHTNPLGLGLGVGVARHNHTHGHRLSSFTLPRGVMEQPQDSPEGQGGSGGPTPPGSMWSLGTPLLTPLTTNAGALTDRSPAPAAAGAGGSRLQAPPSGTSLFQTQPSLIRGHVEGTAGLTASLDAERHDGSEHQWTLSHSRSSLRSGDGPGSERDLSHHPSPGALRPSSSIAMAFGSGRPAGVLVISGRGVWSERTMTLPGWSSDKTNAKIPDENPWRISAVKEHETDTMDGTSNA
ncbi:unnamed protein product [Vitrella brassicaformis CCMP3155]|uniref:UBA domain-containing protein n=1 Tax=Vitrella brassicaformis (strain CCMP3155) TaxID=1169540 RepID=A0A0G4F468_VITBC|nr:unnamed protein product [Vitrella brassicaformis CCMP3155]|eukprot:CEM07038.1 unnamed protein product [Vitrella brassicaformis CCMP3155]